MNKIIKLLMIFIFSFCLFSCDNDNDKVYYGSLDYNEIEIMKAKCSYFSGINKIYVNHKVRQIKPNCVRFCDYEHVYIIKSVECSDGTIINIDNK